MLFNTVEYRKATSKFIDECIKEIDDLQENSKIIYSIQCWKHDSKENVALVLKRINQGGNSA